MFNSVMDSKGYLEFELLNYLMLGTFVYFILFNSACIRAASVGTLPLTAY